ncbi:FecR protein [Durusdinium trenchii]|uniref:FecR protein n=1 Tax=Durusdinium trenchii TaxID=1381693 RepID=A0ABP0LG39_9DINO
MADEPLSGDEFKKLESEIVADPTSRRAYINISWLCGDLTWLYRDHTEEAREAVLPAGTVTVSSLPVDGRRSLWSNPFLAAAVSAIAASMLLYLGGFLRFASPGSTAQQESVSEVAEGDLDTPAEVAATLTGLVDCYWEPDSLAPTYGEPLEPGRTLQLKAGLAKLTFESGAQLILQGPAEFEVASPMDGALHIGKLSAVCPVQAHGFKIATPTAQVVDLGTEFGMEVDAVGDTEVHVFEGEVLTWPVDVEGETAQHAMSLVKDKAAVFKKGLAVEQAFAQANRFVRDISAHLDTDSLPPLPVNRRLQLWLAADVLVKRDDAKRVIAWRDILVGDNQSDEDAWQHDEDARPLWVEDAIGGKPALRFDGEKSHLCTTPFLTTPSQTVFLVFQRDEVKLNPTEKRQLLNYNGPPYDLPKTMRAFRILQIDDMEKAGSFRGYIYAGLEEQNIYAQLGDVRMKEAAEVGEPVVLAYLYDPEANRAELWANNESQGYSNAPAGEQFSSRKIIGRHPLHKTCFDGDIAEVLIYNTALTPDEISQVNTYLGKKYSIPVDSTGDSELRSGTPSDEAAREAARRTECKNKMHQLGIALHNHHDTKGAFPVGAEGRDPTTANLNYNLGGTYNRRVAMAIHLFPFIEQGTLHSNYNFADYHTSVRDPNSPFVASQPAFTCPSDEPQQSLLCDAGTARDYKGNYGVNWGPWSYDCQAVEQRLQRGVVVPLRGCPDTSSQAIKIRNAPFHLHWGAKFRQITDGSSNTLAMMEMVQTPENGTCDRRGRIWNDDFGTYQINTRDTPNSSGADVSGCSSSDALYPCQSSTDVKEGRLVSRSRHPGGVVVMMCDASVQFITDNVDLVAWQAASTIAGGEVESILQ